MNSIELLRPRLVGNRFNGGVLPLDILRDLAVLQEMIIEIAKWQYREEHPDRQRLPRGFASQIEVRLTALEEGSTKLTLSAFFLVGALLSPQDSPEWQYMESAPEALIAVIDAASKGTSITEHLPKKVLSYFDRFGRNLRDGERVDFTDDDGRELARFDQSVRKKLVRASATRDITAEVCIRATVPEADQDKKTFTLKRYDGTKLTAPLPDSQLDTVLEAFSGFANNLHVEVRGVARINAQNRAVGFDEVHHVDVLDPSDIGVQLDDLRSLKNGWFDNKGLAPSIEGLDWLTEWFEQQIPSTLPFPYLYPTPEGGVQAEWTFDIVELSMEIDLSQKCAEWHLLNMHTDKDEERSLNLISTGDVAWLVKRLQELHAEVA